MLTDFDTTLFDDPGFKEDAVREEIIAPMLRRLGYRPSGATRVVRSKVLTHPFIRIGTRQHPVNTIPDYTLFQDDKAILVLDAKSPSEDILKPEHVQQAYSYAIHPEIRCDHFALCNGKQLAVFHIQRQDPLLLLPFQEFDARWIDIEKHLTPRYLLDPALRLFSPDFGFAIARLGMSADCDLIFPGTRLGLFGRVDDEIYTASVNCALEGKPHCASFDFAHSLLDPILAGLPKGLLAQFRRALARAPYQAHADLMLEIDIVTRLGPPTMGQHEPFVPLVITQVLASRFKTEAVAGDPGDIPAHVFRLQAAFLTEGGAR